MKSLAILVIISVAYYTTAVQIVEAHTANLAQIKTYGVR